MSMAHSCCSNGTGVVDFDVSGLVLSANTEKGECQRRRRRLAGGMGRTSLGFRFRGRSASETKIEGGRRKGEDRLDKLSEHLSFFTALGNDVLDLRHVLRHLARYRKKGREAESERAGGREGGREAGRESVCYREMIESARERARKRGKGERVFVSLVQKRTILH